MSPYSAEEADDEEKEFREKIALLREKGEFPVAPEGMNKELSEEFGMKFGGLRKRLLGDPARKHYCEPFLSLFFCLKKPPLFLLA